MKTLTVTALAGMLLASTAGLAAAQAGRHIPAQQVSHPIPDDVQGGSGSATFSHRPEQGDVAVYVKVVNDGDCVMRFEKQRLRANLAGRDRQHLRGRDRFTVQPGHSVIARYEKTAFDVTVWCSEAMMPGGDCGGSVTMIPVRRGEPNESMGRLGALEVYSGSPMPMGATCADMPVDLPLLHVKYGRVHMDTQVVNGGSAKTGCTTFEVTRNGETLVADYAGGGGGEGRVRVEGVESVRLQARCTGGGDGCQGSVKITLTP